MNEPTTRKYLPPQMREPLQKMIKYFPPIAKFEQPAQEIEALTLTTEN
jgi:hypothetical protein